MEKTKLPEPIPVTMEQFECQYCKKKFYVNAEDFAESNMPCPCPFCGATNIKNTRQFDVSILAITDKQ